MNLIDTAGRILRFNQVLLILAKHGFLQLSSRLHIKNTRFYRWLFDQPDDWRDLGRRLRNVLEELGPTYIKLGQILSTRYDIFPPEVIAELESLQDAVEPLPFRVVRRQIERSSGQRIETLFAWIDETPLATASIAQVHRAMLRSGESVAVKVRKPGIERKIRYDLEIMTTLAELAERNFATKAVLRPTNVVHAFREAVIEEIDFDNERRNLLAFHKNFEDFDEVVIPRLYEAYCTKDLLVMEYLDGVRITEAVRDETTRKLAAKRSFAAVLKMLFEDGLYHADPHPSNVFLLEDDRVAFLDLGLVGRMDDTMRKRFFQLVSAAYRKDYERVADVFQAMSKREHLLPGGMNRERMLEDLRLYLGRHADLKAKDFSVFAALKEFLQRSRKYNLVIPAEYTMIFKTLFTIEEVGTRLDPDFDLNAAVLDFSAHLFAKYPELLEV
ncbi:MAG: AarF/ABC1/UbiB kinase family protein [Deltaproteobacteria bacterium]|nr:MAG: AarF/ABC1/UbiB kinase family protein [Deltaproteobacteria bacterium]